MVKRVGISTGGGDAPGLNAVIRGIVRTGIATYGWEVIGIEDGFDGLIKPNKLRQLRIDDMHNLVHEGGTILGTTNRGNPFKYPIEKGEGDQVEIQDISGLVVENMRNLRLDALVVIGGDGSLKISDELYKMGAPIVGVPKTIDNDLCSTDLTFGFDTAVHTATDAIDKLRTTADSHHRIMILEVMGRDAGWIALHSGIAGGAHVILIPEIPFDIEEICRFIRQREWEGRKSSIIVIAEGAVPTGGGQSIIAKEASGVVRLGGVGQQLAEQLTKMTKKEVRVTVLGHLQRGGSPSPYDRILATRFGVAAAHLVAQRGFGRMVSLQNNTITSVSLEDATGQMKTVDPDGEMIKVARDIGIIFG